VGIDGHLMPGAGQGLGVAAQLRDGVQRLRRALGAGFVRLVRLAEVHLERLVVLAGADYEAVVPAVVLPAPGLA
jgi:hypothetical protein